MRWTNHDDGPPDWVQGEACETIIPATQWRPVRVAADGVIVYASQEASNWELSCCSTSPSYALAFPTREEAVAWLAAQKWFTSPSPRRGPVRVGIHPTALAFTGTPPVEFVF